MIYVLLEAILLSLAISIDTLVVGFGYGISKIKIPFRSALLLSIINTFILGLSTLIGYFLSNVLPQSFSKWMSFSILLCVGFFKFFSELLKLWLSKKVKQDNSIKIKLFNFNLILKVMVDPSKADKDNNKILSLLETISVALVLSLDQIGVGLSHGMNNAYPYMLTIANFITCLLAVFIGVGVGKKVSSFAKINLSWLSGLLLIVMALIKIF